ncbi:MAG: nucleotidyltransferase family protein, partial [Lachnospiraceae bacterium]|nr:nucleotidyltransferase family protein [Lachnospiraceae bacterium]
FAYGAVSLLTALHSDFVAFGTECGETEPLMELAGYLREEPAPFKEALNESLKAGNPFPVARRDAVVKCLGFDHAKYLNEPNNLLGIEYCKAILKLKEEGKNPPKPITIKRESNFNDTELEPGMLPSALALRIPLVQGDISTARSFIPEKSVWRYEKALQAGVPGKFEKLSKILAYCLLTETEESIAKYADWNEDLANRVLGIAKESNVSFAELPYKLKSKNITYTRASRMLLSLVLKKKNNTLQRAIYEGGAFYARILGVNSASTSLLKAISDKADIPVINKVATGELELSGTAKELLQADITAANFYNLLFCENAPDDYRNGIVLV